MKITKFLVPVVIVGSLLTGCGRDNAASCDSGNAMGASPNIVASVVNLAAFAGPPKGSSSSGSSSHSSSRPSSGSKPSGGSSKPSSGTKTPSKPSKPVAAKPSKPATSPSKLPATRVPKVGDGEVFKPSAGKYTPPRANVAPNKDQAQVALKERPRFTSRSSYRSSVTNITYSYHAPYYYRGLGISMWDPYDAFNPYNYWVIGSPYYHQAPDLTCINNYTVDGKQIEFTDDPPQDIKGTVEILNDKGQG